MRTVVIGNGMAATRLANDLLATERTWELTILGDEGTRAYNRVQLSNLLAGKTTSDAMVLPQPRGPNLRLLPANRATGIDRDRHTVTDTTGIVHPYDTLVLATGAAATVPPIAGLNDPMVLRTLDDCHRILERASTASTAIVLGGGLLGIEAARALAARGIAVTIVHTADRLMNRQLDYPASELLIAALANLGITAILSAKAVAALDGDRGLVLADGRTVTADLLIVSCGIRPRTELARAAGLHVEHGIVIDDRLRTSDDSIAAIGDCAWHPTTTGGLLAPAWAQASVLAMHLTGRDQHATYRPTPPVTRLKADGIDLATMGPSAAWAETAGPTCHLEPDAMVFADPARGRYARLVIRDRHLVSAIMLGDQPAVAAVIQHFDTGSQLPADPRQLLLHRPGSAPGDTAATGPASPALMPDTAVVCRCNTVTKQALTKAWLDGARDLRTATRAATGCGGCANAVDGFETWLASIDEGTPAAAGQPG